jgi:hypothetical protein
VNGIGGLASLHASSFWMNISFSFHFILTVAKYADNELKFTAGTEPKIVSHVKGRV